MDISDQIESESPLEELWPDHEIGDRLGDTDTG